MEQSLKEILLKFYQSHPGQAFAAFEIMELIRKRVIVKWGGEEIFVTERSVSNRSYDLACDIKTGINSRHRKRDGKNLPYVEYGLNIQEELF